MNDNELFKLSRKYPSIINNGYRHIEVAIELISEYKLHKGFSILDIGAASGIITTMFANSFPENNVIAFEPISDSFQHLNENTSYLKNVKTYNLAIGKIETQLEINISNRITSSSLFTINEKITDAYFAENLTKKSSEIINISSLDKLIPSCEQIAMIKMDVQGYEIEVLKGAEESLKRTRFVLTELMNHDFYNNAPRYYAIDEFLRNSGFELLDIIPSIRSNNKLMEWDTFYFNKSLIKI